MLIFEKGHGYPMTLMCETTNAKDEGFADEGYVTVVFDENHKKVSEFYHNELHDRALWAKGFYEGLEFKKEE